VGVLRPRNRGLASRLMRTVAGPSIMKKSIKDSFCGIRFKSLFGSLRAKRELLNGFPDAMFAV